MRISNWSSDVCSSDLTPRDVAGLASGLPGVDAAYERADAARRFELPADREGDVAVISDRSEEHTSELQSLMRISYAVFSVTKQKTPMSIRPEPTATNKSHKTCNKSDTHKEANS